MILKLENFCNEQGMQVQQRTMVSGPAAPFHQFVGTIGVGTKDNIQHIEFAIDAETLEEAFLKFKECADAKYAQMKRALAQENSKKDIKKSNIIVPE